jgi:RHS repeat-associated protein
LPELIREYGGANGEKLGVYSIGQWYDNNGNAHSIFSPMRTSVWFGGKLIYENGLVYLDRLGTNHAQNAQFLPFGDEITSTSNDRTKFATYTRDSYTGLDYADQRFYASTYGRFMTPDPSYKGVHLRIPKSWDLYEYSGNDPVEPNGPNGRGLVLQRFILRGPEHTDRRRITADRGWAQFTRTKRRTRNSGPCRLLWVLSVVLG